MATSGVQDFDRLYTLSYMKQPPYLDILPADFVLHGMKWAALHFTRLDIVVSTVCSAVSVVLGKNTVFETPLGTSRANVYFISVAQPNFGKSEAKQHLLINPLVNLEKKHGCSLFCTSLTPSGLQSFMAKNNEQALLVADESHNQLVEFFNNKSTSYAGFRSKLNDLWSGGFSKRVLATRKNQCLNSPYLSMICYIQPQPWYDAVKQALSLTDGLFGRFLLSCSSLHQFASGEIDDLMMTQLDSITDEMAELFPLMVERMLDVIYVTFRGSNIHRVLKPDTDAGHLILEKTQILNEQTEGAMQLLENAVLGGADTINQFTYSKTSEKEGEYSCRLTMIIHVIFKSWGTNDGIQFLGQDGCFEVSSDCVNRAFQFVASLGKQSEIYIDHFKQATTSGQPQSEVLSSHTASNMADLERLIYNFQGRVLTTGFLIGCKKASSKEIHECFDRLGGTFNDPDFVGVTVRVDGTTKAFYKALPETVCEKRINDVGVSLRAYRESFQPFTEHTTPVVGIKNWRRLFHKLDSSCPIGMSIHGELPAPDPRIAVPTTSSDGQRVGPFVALQAVFNETTEQSTSDVSEGLVQMTPASVSGDHKSSD